MQDFNLLQEGSIDGAIREFVVSKPDYYQKQFKAIFQRSRCSSKPNFAALLLGPIWAASRGMFGLFAIVALIELAFALTIVGVATGGLGQAEAVQAQQLQLRSEARKAQAAEAQKTGDDSYHNLVNSAISLERAAKQATHASNRKQRKVSFFLVGALATWLSFRTVFGFFSNRFYARQFELWRGDRSQASGIKASRTLVALLILAVVFLLSSLKVATNVVPTSLSALSIWLDGIAATKTLTTSVSQSLDSSFRVVTNLGGPIFDAITTVITAIITSVELGLLAMPWPAIIIIIVGLSLRIAGLYVGAFTAVGLIFLVAFGFWEKSMTTVALLGTATFLALSLGLPLGVLCGKRASAYKVARPVLDLMQTMPAFVYLIPIIAFFGTGKTPGILATIVFGMPPVARLTALGLQQVPENVREATTAFGASPWQLLTKVEIPLAMPSIMAGVNQTILLCLSMVVIASLIGAGGLGEEVLQALQFASVGQGILAGLAILFCAIILDRIVQGRRSH
ncbi:ABC transporter permease [Rhizobium mongolense]|uniref:Glycine betaine/proline transport system permease protein n=1 Tax=Rhizobium mongolense TaxID=57676 RepID=A0A7W6RRN2_9HYPH|nr:ABC transporter permease subunit [Rhizobium mongolense]MBB4276693.1 glycine betaine/proline transport system permease protein [Rhizobium mongolense]